LLWLLFSGFGDDSNTVDLESSLALINIRQKGTDFPLRNNSTLKNLLRKPNWLGVCILQEVIFPFLAFFLFHNKGIFEG
jgi:hypothetical protein